MITVLSSCFTDYCYTTFSLCWRTMLLTSLLLSYSDALPSLGMFTIINEQYRYFTIGLWLNQLPSTHDWHLDMVLMWHIKEFIPPSKSVPVLLLDTIGHYHQGCVTLQHGHCFIDTTPSTSGTFRLMIHIYHWFLLQCRHPHFSTASLSTTFPFCTRLRSLLWCHVNTVNFMWHSIRSSVLDTWQSPSIANKIMWLWSPHLNNPWFKELS